MFFALSWQSGRWPCSCTLLCFCPPPPSRQTQRFQKASADSMRFTLSSIMHPCTHTQTEIKRTFTMVLLCSVTMVSVRFNAWQHVSRGNHSPRRGGHFITAQVFDHETNFYCRGTRLEEAELKHGSGSSLLSPQSPLTHTAVYEFVCSPSS